MKTIKEVSELLGITRRTLQEYDRIGLLSPTNKKEIKDGKFVQWKYDDDAISMLKLIILFVEAGYKRNDIKEFIRDPKILKRKFRELETVLEEKKNRINWLLSEVKLSRIYLEIPDSLIGPLYETSKNHVNNNEIDTNDIMKELEQIDLENPEIRDMLKMQAVFGGMVYFNEKASELSVQKYVYDMLLYLAKLFLKYDDGVEYTDEEIRQELDSSTKAERSEFLNPLIESWSNSFSDIDSTFGEGKGQYAKDALEYFKEHGKTWEK